MIELDSGTSFEIDDFDPLNQNAKKLPILSKAPSPSSIVLPTISTTAAAATKPQSRIQAFSNPVYPFHMPNQPPKPQYPPPPSQQSTVIPSSSGHVLPPNNQKFLDDDVELLRKYGLDRFKLVDTNRTTCNGSDTKTNMTMNRTHDPFTLNNGIGTDNRHSSVQQRTNNNWTTFD